MTVVSPLRSLTSFVLPQKVNNITELRVALPHFHCIMLRNAIQLANDHRGRKRVAESTASRMTTTTETRGDSIGFAQPKRNFQNDVHRQEVVQMFEKKFQYQRKENEEWRLPPATELYQEFYQLNTLQNLRDRLNGVKSKLNDFVIEEWSLHTRRKDPSGEIPWRLKNETNAEFVTVAWCKFFECLHRFPLVTRTKFNSLHLCEAPGAFIAALNHYLRSTFDADEIQWKWLSTTLNPYYEGNPLSRMIADDRFMLYTLDNWIFHGDFTGNIMCRTNIEHMQEQCEKRLDGEVHLITADGSIDCVETPDRQEEMVAQLHFAEITAALSILAHGGCFVVKMFTLFNAESVSKLFLLHCVFEQVHVFKPATSKRGNSEVYVICLKYRKDTKHLPEIIEVMKAKVDACLQVSSLLPMFSKAHLPSTFMQQHEICARFFMNLQIRAIERNISSFVTKLRHDTRRNHHFRTLVCAEFYKRYQVKPIPKELTILYTRQGKIEEGMKTFLYRGSYSERELLKDTALEEQIFGLRKTLNDLEKLIPSRNDVLLDSDSTDVSSLDVTIYRGTPYKTMYNSLFADVPLLQLRQKLQNVYAFDPLYHIPAKCQISDEEILLITDEHENLSDFFAIQRKFMLKILKAIVAAHPSEVSFTDFAFLTHFTVSILLFLATNIFRKLVITTEPLTIHLSKPNYNEGTMQTFDAMQSAIDEDPNVLCLVDITRLHRNDFSRALYEFNNLLLLRNLKSMLCS